MGEVTNLMSVDEKQAEESWDRVDAGPVVSVKLTVGSVITGMEIADELRRGRLSSSAVSLKGLRTRYET